MNAMVAEYYALKTEDYMRDVVRPKSIRQELLLTELARGQGLAETTTGSSPRVWSRPFRAVRSAFAAAEHGFVARVTRRAAAQ